MLVAEREREGRMEGMKRRKKEKAAELAEWRWYVYGENERAGERERERELANR